ncbi:MAG: DUF6314 family protein [Boseongicola sp.]
MSGLPSLAVLEGAWLLSRIILHEDGARDELEGEAKFHRSGPRLIHDEEGWLTSERAAAPMKAKRRYVWSVNGNRIDIAFEDMRPFHSIPIGAATPGTTYLCPPDRYEVQYDFQKFPEWSSTWIVEGPRKSYRMTSHYVRKSE